MAGGYVTHRRRSFSASLPGINEYHNSHSAVFVGDAIMDDVDMGARLHQVSDSREWGG